jgi:hypothetical protein
MNVMVNAVRGRRWSDTFYSLLWPLDIWTYTIPKIVQLVNKPTDVPTDVPTDDTSSNTPSNTITHDEIYNTL